MSSSSPSYQHRLSHPQDHPTMPSYLLSSLAASANQQQHQQPTAPHNQLHHNVNIHGRTIDDENEMSKQVEARMNAINGYSVPDQSPQASLYDGRALAGVSMNPNHQPPIHSLATRSVGSGMQRFNRGGSDFAAPTHKNLYVLNLPLDATTDQLAALFGSFGAVSHCVILAMLDAQARRRGFIDMGAASEAKAAIEGLNGFVWHGYPIEVSYAIVQRSGGPFEQASGANVIKRNVPRNRFNTGPRRIPTEHIHSAGGYALQRSGSNNSSGPPSPSCYSDGSGVSSMDSPITSDPCTIFISGLDPAAILDDDDLKHALEPYGRILSGFLSKDENGISRGFGVVSFSNPEEATRASLGLDGKMLNGRRISAHNLHYQREVARGQSPSSMAHSGVNDYFSKMIQSSNSSASSSPRGSFSHQLSGQQHSPSNGYATLPVGGRYSPSQLPGFLPPHSPHGISSSLPSSRRLDQIPMGAIGAAPGTFGRPSPPSSLGYSAAQPYPLQSQAQQHPFFRSANGGARPIDIHPDARLSGFNYVKLGDAFVPRGAAALAERLGISKSPNESSLLAQAQVQAQAQAHHSDVGSTSSHGSKNQRRTSVESHGSSSGSQRSIGSERAASIEAAQSPASNGLPGSLALPWNYTPGGALGLDNLSPASTMSIGSTASSISNLNTPDSGMTRSENGGVSGMGAGVDHMWGRSAVLISGSKWNPLNGTAAGTKDLLTGGEIVSRKEEVSLAGLGPVGHEKLSSSPRRSERRSDHALDLSSLGQHL